jgi:hypothetical protein
MVPKDSSKHAICAKSDLDENLNPNGEYHPDKPEYGAFKAGYCSNSSFLKVSLIMVLLLIFLSFI